MTQHPLRTTFERFDEPISADFRNTLRASLLADLNTTNTTKLDVALRDIDQSQEITVFKEIDGRDRLQPRRRALIGAAALVIIAIGVGALVIKNHDSAPTLGPSVATQYLRGTFTLVDDGINGSGTTCHGTGGYNDFRPGLDATISDANGSVVGAGTLRNMTEADIGWLIEDDTRTGFLSDAGFRPTLPDGSPSNTGSATDPAARARALLGVDDFRAGRKCTLVFDIEVNPAAAYVLEVGAAGSPTYAATDQTYTADQLTEVGYFVNVVRGS